MEKKEMGRGSVESWRIAVQAVKGIKSWTSDKRVEKLGNGEANTGMGVRRIPRQIEMPTERFYMVSTEALGFLQANDAQGDGVEGLGQRFKFSVFCECEASRRRGVAKV